MRIPFFVLLTSTAALRAAVPNNIVRPDIQNAHYAGSAVRGVSFFNGTISNGTNATPPASQNNVLRESAFGQPFATYLSPYGAFSDDVLFNGRVLAGGQTVPGVFTVLYPPGYKTPNGVNLGRAAIKNSSKVFRYKWLMYGEDPSDDDPNPAILNIFHQSADSSDWFTDADRAEARVQIDVLREALAHDPWNRDLQSALLDIYYDWTVAEMQFARNQLVALSTVRLGLVAPPKFVIDEEIKAYEKLISLTETVLELYCELLSFSMTGVKSRDFFESSINGGLPDPSGGAPLGYFIFQNTVPLRNQTPTQYADDNSVQNVVNPGDSNTFSGFKDYRTLLTVLGQHIQYQADLARLRGMRRATTVDGPDLTLARLGLTDAQSLATTAGLLGNMFRQYDFNDVQYDDTGVRSARTLVQTALIDAMGARGFLNGTSNALGLDPNFLLLLPPEPGNNLFDSYDLLTQKLNTVQGGLAVGPLAVATELLGDPTNTTSGGGAIQAYSAFRETVDSVETEIINLEFEYAERFEDITGYNHYTEANLWDGTTPEPTRNSELRSLERSIESYKKRGRILSDLTGQHLADLGKAREAISLAEGIAGTITGAGATYESQTSEAWTEIHLFAGLATAAQGAFDTISSVSSTSDAKDLLTGGVLSTTVAIAGATNTVLQTTAAVRTSMRQQEIERASIAYNTTLALADAPLTVKQAQLELGALLREGYSNLLELEDNNTALLQSSSDRMGLLREIQRGQVNLRSSRELVAGRYHADPIHFIRSEQAILRADAAFRTAQRWVFFTARALEYKWSERFSIADPLIGESYDIGSIIKARNAIELKTIVQKMAQWNLNRTGTPVSNITVISLRDQFVTPNPADTNRAFSPLLDDKGLRYDLGTGTVIGKQEHFRRLLDSYRDSSGNIVIPFDTTQLENFGTFFKGPVFSSNPDSGFYRNKIDWIAVNLIASDGVTPPNINGRPGRLIYGGNTFFRTRVPVHPDRNTAVTTSSGEAFDSRKDFGSEFIVAPFRFFQDTNFTGAFDLFDVQNINSMKLAYSRDSANTQSVLDRLTDTSFGFRRNDFKERSVAATRWQLIINANQVNLADLQDVELVIRHIAYPRPQIQGN